MKRWIAVIAAMAMCLALAPGAMAQPSQEELMQQMMSEIQALKARVGELEDKLATAHKAAAEAQASAEEARKMSAGSLKASREMQVAKESEGKGFTSELGKRLKVYGAVEVEAKYERKETKSGKSTNNSDITLSTAEIFFEAQVNKYVKGLLHLLWEEDNTEPLDIDEGFILLGQTDDIPAYLMAGRMYPAIGLFETYLVSDPITQDMFETQASAAEVGWLADCFSVGVGVFNSDVQETGDDDHINTYYGRLQVNTPEGAIEDFMAMAGVAYTNNIASGNLSGYVPGALDSLVGGWSVMASAQYKIVGFTAEYIASIDDFKAGELDYDSAKLSPKAWNVELAVMPWDQWTFAARYEGSSDSGSEFPETQWGLGVSWAFLPDTTLSLEYLRGDYKNDDTRDLFTTQLAVGF